MDQRAVQQTIPTQSFTPAPLTHIMLPCIRPVTALQQQINTPPPTSTHRAPLIRHITPL
jgi:hypothetical protein